MSPLPVKLMKEIGDAYKSGEHGDHHTGKTILRRCLRDIEALGPLIDPYEQLMILGASGNACQKCEMWKEAASIFEQACSLAVQVEPDAIETAGDFRELGVSCAALGLFERARKSYKKAKEVILRIQAPEPYIKDIDELLKKLPTDQKETAEMLPLLEQILARRPLVQRDAVIKKAPLSKTQKIKRADKLKHVSQHPIAKELVKVLVMDSVEDEHPRLPINPLEVHVYGNGETGNALDFACRNHATDCKELEVDVPLVLSIPQAYLESSKQYLASVSYRGLNPDEVYWLSEVETPLFRYCEGEMVAAPENGTRLFGGAITVLSMIESPLLSSFWERGIRWLLLGQLWNLGCRINAEALKPLEYLSGVGIIECMERTHVAKSKLILVQAVGDQSLTRCIDEHRLRSEDTKHISEKALWAGIGSFWINCEQLVTALGFDPKQALSKWNEQHVKPLIYDLVQKHSILHHHPEGLLSMNLPLWEIFSSIDLKPIRVPQWRYQLCLEPTD